MAIPEFPMRDLTENEAWSADWVQGYLDTAAKMGRKPKPAHQMSPFNRFAVALLARMYRTGIYNVQAVWEKTDWRAGRGVMFVVHAGGGLSTFDFDHLTRAVLVAHEEAVRIDISSHGFGYWKIYMHPRGREGGMSERHPTIEQAVEAFRGGKKA